MSSTSKTLKVDQKPRRLASKHPPRPTRRRTGSPAPVVRVATAGTPLAQADLPTTGPSGGPRRSGAGESHTVIDHAENLVHYVVAGILMAVVFFTLYEASDTLANSIAKSSVLSVAMNVVNGVIFAVIIFEIIRTVLLRFDKEVQLQRLLTIGMVCAMRDVLSVGAGLTLNDMATKEAPHTSLLELGMNAAVVLGLAVSLVLIRRYGSTPSDDEKPEDAA